MKTLEITIVEDKKWKNNNKYFPSFHMPMFFLGCALGCVHRHSIAPFPTQYVSKEHVITIQHHKQGHSNHFLCGSRTTQCDQLTLANMPWSSRHSHLPQPSHCSLHSQPSMAIYHGPLTAPNLPWDILLWDNPCRITQHDTCYPPLFYIISIVKNGNNVEEKWQITFIALSYLV